LRRAFDDRAMASGIAAGVLLVFAAINCIMAWHHIRRRGFARRACDDRAMASGIAAGVLLVFAAINCIMAWSLLACRRGRALRRAARRLASVHVMDFGQRARPSRTWSWRARSPPR
jgi:hypothetical protein